MKDSHCDTIHHKIEDTLNNIRSLQTLLRFVFENTTDDELLTLKGEMTTALYMLGDQVGTAQGNIDADKRRRINPPPRPDPAPAPA